MAIKSQPHRLQWSTDVRELNEVNRRLADQLYKADQMLEILFKAVKDLTERVEALE
jgi:hypothetical protein